ncbi:hypothetical protein ACFPH6_33550 [Streptomyces xiangluensis]|uniref:NAD(+)--protein-arginine ADP-ribosyltransferase n=1 Tax=Streptomyces xiangluensis TaxID=2665720 RepID=A0ABV8YXP2_9ACTN
MSIPDSSPGLKRDVCSVPVPLRTPGSAEYRVQPVPNAARIIPTGGRGIAWDRLRLWRTYGDRYRKAMASAEEALTRSLGPTGGIRHNRVDVLADLAAVHLYLTEEWEKLDEALSEGTVGGHLSLARCLASGLRRLASYRGPATVGTSTVGAVTDWYRENRFVTEQGFWTASASAAALREGGPGFVVWSLTARRTAAVAPHAPEQLIFLPGTRFKVLRVIDGRQPLVLMREMFPPEPAGHQPDDASRDGATWLDESTLADLESMTADSPAANPFMSVTSIVTGPRQRPPGLIVT